MTAARRGAHWRDTRLGEPRELALPQGTVRYQDTGSGPVLVFVHGYLVNANIWRGLVPLLADSYRCITPDWPLGSHLMPMRPETDLSPPGMARLIADLLDALDLRNVTLIGNDSGGAYAQLVAAEHPGRIGRLVLNSCETPYCTWPPTPGGFGLLKTTASNALTYRALYQILRLQRTWRWRNTYGWLAKHPVPEIVMHSYIRPVLSDPGIRVDGRKAIGGVSERYSRQAATHLERAFDKPLLLAWGADDRVFPLRHARRYAHTLDAPLTTIPDAYTYTSEDSPEATAHELRAWLARTGRGSSELGSNAE